MPPDLRQIDELFQAALAVPRDGREAILSAATVDDDIRTHVRAMLAAHDVASGYFRDLQADLPSVHALDGEPMPARIGPYQPTRILGRGGMGTVYLAVRADGQFDQQVAVKLLRPGADTTAGVRRFLSERQIVARLEHPNIARLIDGGITADGRPYFVMEYVEGQSLLTFSNAARLSIADRLALTMTVADALQYAHQRLVVHRDVKPSNILVTADRTVKVVDFGIAKEIDPSGSAPVVTESGGRVLTLPYAAPEQIRGEPVTTATDVYGLGVVLYELLAGRRPHEVATGEPRHLERAILEDTPMAPSAVVSDAAAAERGLKADRLRRRLAGDLDTICLMALRKEPARRYATAAQFADDLRRHLRGQPVQARPDAWRYRTVKFVRRHAVGVAAGAAIVALLAGVAAVTVVQNRRVARERDRAQAITDLLVRLFEVADPGEARGASVTAREVLNRGVERIHAELGPQPELKARLLAVMGRVYQNLGLYREATPLVEMSLALQRQTLGPSHRDVLATLTSLAEIFRLRGEFAAATTLLQEALPLSERIAGSTSPELARVLNGLAKIHIAAGRPADAEAFARRALDLNRGALGPDHAEVGESLMNLGAALFSMGRDADAEPHFRAALAVRRAALGADHPAVPAALTNLAALLSRKGEFTEAETAHREALVLNRRIFGDEHPRVATTLNNLALVLFARRDFAAAEPLYREALAIRRRMLTAAHPETAQSLANLGLLLQTTGRLDEAEAVYREALEIRRAALGPAHALVAQSLNNLGLLLQAKGRLDAAEPLFRQSLEMLRQQLSPGHPLVATSLHNLAALRAARRDAAEAERLFRDALEIRRRALPRAHPETLLTLVGLGRALLDLRRPSDAEPWFTEVYDAVRAAPPGPTDEARQQLILAYEALGRPDRAAALRTGATGR